MHHEIVSVEPRASISAAGAIMVANNLRSLPVVERQNDHLTLVGMVSRGDVLRGLRFQLVEGSLCQIGSRRLAAAGERPSRQASRRSIG